MHFNIGDKVMINKDLICDYYGLGAEDYEEYSNTHWVIKSIESGNSVEEYDYHFEDDYENYYWPHSMLIPFIEYSTAVKMFI